MVLPRVDTYNLYEECFCGKPAFYIRHKDRPATGIFSPGNPGKDCLETQKTAIREDEMKISGYIFLILSWGLILGLAYFCFVKIFSKKELK